MAGASARPKVDACVLPRMIADDPGARRPARGVPLTVLRHRADGPPGREQLFRVGVDIAERSRTSCSWTGSGRLQHQEGLLQRRRLCAGRSSTASARSFATRVSAGRTSPRCFTEPRWRRTRCSKQRGARTGLITTRGFRDVLEIRRLRMPRLYDLTWEKPAPLVERYLRQEVTSASTRTARSRRRSTWPRSSRPRNAPPGGHRGPRRLLDQLLREPRARGADQGARQPSRPRPVGLLQRRGAPGDPRVRAHLDHGDQRLRDPIVRRYLATLRAGLDGVGVKTPLLIMQSNGGLMTDAPRPCIRSTYESGPGPASWARRPSPAASASGSSSRSTWRDDRESVDRRRTAGDPPAEYRWAAAIMHGSRCLTGGGYLSVPAIDWPRSGAGAARGLDHPGGSLQVAPAARGRRPGPLLRPGGPSRRSPMPT